MVSRGKTTGARFWTKAEPLVLASASAGRRLALQQTGVPFIVQPASIDERAIEAPLLLSGAGADQVAAELAKQKALAVSQKNPRSLVLGADQTASCDRRILAKPADIDAAREQLRFLSGRSHRLHSAACIAIDGAVVFQTIAHADLKMRELSPAFLDAYLQDAADAALSSVGCYQLEALGVHLFESISGDYWTILGLPLLAVLDALRRERALLA
jgi:septum formation protein